MVVCAEGLGEASWEVSRRRTEQRSFPQEQGFEHSPTQVESMLKSAAEMVKVIGGNWATSFWLCNPFPKHSHTTTLFQSSLSRNTSHGALLRAGRLNQLVFFFFFFFAQSLTRSQASFPELSPPTFTQHSQLIWSMAISGGGSLSSCSSGLLPSLQRRELLDAAGAAPAARWLSGNLQTRAMNCRDSPGRVLLAHTCLRSWN